MKNILLEIKKLDEGNERNFLLQSLYSTEKYIKSNDKQSLKNIVLRLNGLYPAMSEKAQEISLMIINEIMEVQKKK